MNIPVITPLFGAIIKFIYDLFGQNYMLALVIFAVLVKLILFPFGIKQQKNSLLPTKQIKRITKNKKSPNVNSVIFYILAYGNVNSHVGIRRIEVCGYIGLGPGGNAPRRTSSGVRQNKIIYQYLIGNGF